MRRRPTEDEIEDWFAGTARPSRPHVSEVRVLQDSIRKKNPVRWHRLQKDLAWLRKQMVKHGHPPEKARWLL